MLALQNGMAFDTLEFLSNDLESDQSFFPPKDKCDWIYKSELAREKYQKFFDGKTSMSHISL